MGKVAAELFPCSLRERPHGQTTLARMGPGGRGCVTTFRFLVAVFLLTSCAPHDDASVYKQTAYAMGSIVEFTVVGVNEPRAQAAVAAAIDDLNFMHAAYHPWQPGALARMNALFPVGGKFTAAASLLPLIAQGSELSAKSGGLFNPAVGKLVQLWGFDKDGAPSGPPPAPDKIAALLARLPRMSDIHVTGIEIESTNPDVLLDFGAIAQGYAADLLVDGFRERGIHNALINISGDVRVIGQRVGKPWRVGIRHPRGDGVLASVEMGVDEALVTSGDYERYFTYQGQRYHHILDPRSGYPARGATSVTVIDARTTVADAAATALMVAGPQHWYEAAKNMGIKSVLLVGEDGRVYMDPRTAQRIHFEIDPPPQIVLSAPL